MVGFWNINGGVLKEFRRSSERVLEEFRRRNGKVSSEE